MDHSRPFHRSTKAFTLFPSTCPTAVQARAEVQETPKRLPNLGAGIGSIDHLCPFQRWASNPWFLATFPYPTAMQARGEVHDTPASNERPRVLGVG